ncbi:MAG: flippase [Limosilactobacillus vaginalis]|uniref:flippase n=1 Tax=Limosilactobacillus vaginalis TaxID=1633 RepID=UPI003F114F05
MIKKKSLSINAFFNSLQTLLNLIFPLITFPYVSRTLSVDGIGKYSFSNSIISYFILIAGLGISRFAVREGAKYREDRNEFSDFASKVFTINLCSTFLSYILLFISLLFFQSLRSYKSAILIFSIQIFLTTLGTDWIYTIYEEYRYITIRNISFKIISIVLLLSFVRNRDNYLQYVAVSVFANSGSYILNFVHLNKFCDLRIYWRFNWIQYLIPIFIIFGTMMAVTIYVNADMTMLGLFKTNYVVGIYSISSKIYGMIGPIVSAGMAVLIPRLSVLAGKNRMEEYKELLNKLINFMIILLPAATTGLFMTSRLIVIFIAGNQYLRSETSLRILSLALFFGTINTIFVECILIPLKKEMKTLISAMCGAGINILLNFIMIPMLSENGAAITTVLAELLCMSMNLYFSKRVVLPMLITKDFLKNIISAIIGCIGVIIVCQIINMLCVTLIVKLFISIFLSVVVYIVILIVLRNKVVINILKNKKIF